MKLANKIKCHYCKEIIPEENICIQRTLILPDAKYQNAIENTKLIKTMDSFIAKCTCSKCEKEFKALVTFDASPISVYTGEGNDNLVTIEKEDK